jgi:hypothetical protein
VFAALHKYRFLPAGSAVLKKASPGAQATGSTAPVLNGRVETAREKSTFLACEPRSIVVCENVQTANNA